MGFHINEDYEGPKFTVNDILFQGEVLFSDEELLGKIKLKVGADYSEDLLRRDIQGLTEIYKDKGYAFANVLRTLNVIPGENKVDVEFFFEKGKMAYFGKVIIKGNTKTRDKVILRELILKEGEKFSGSALRRSKENVNRLGFFEPNSVIFNTVSSKGRDDVLDIEIEVKESNTGQISLGAGYNSESGWFIQSSVAQNNFNGLGQTLSFTFNHAKDAKKFDLAFADPYLFDSKWSGRSSLFFEENENELSLYEHAGGTLQGGYPIFDYTRLYATYKLVNTENTQKLKILKII